MHSIITKTDHEDLIRDIFGLKEYQFSVSDSSVLDEVEDISICMRDNRINSFDPNPYTYITTQTELESEFQNPRALKVQHICITWDLLEDTIIDYRFLYSKLEYGMIEHIAFFHDEVCQTLKLELYDDEETRNLKIQYLIDHDDEVLNVSCVYKNNFEMLAHGG